MIYLKEFSNNKDYSDIMNNVEIQIEVPSVSYCDDADDVHFNTYKLIKFYVGEITPPQTVKIYTDRTTSVDVTVSEGNKWYTYILPQNKGLSKIESGTYDTDTKEWSNGIVKKVIVKANINHSYDESNIIPYSTIEAFFKGSDTSNVTNMFEMFNGRRSLTSLDVSSFDTSKVTNMSSMFYWCNHLTSLDVSGFDTSNVTKMNGMFYNCRRLTSLDVSSFDTSGVTNMSSMFSDCGGLTSLDVSSFNTSNVTRMSSMFSDCSGLKSLDLRNFNTSKVTSMYGMFSNCSGLTSLDLSGLDTSKVTNMGYMFYNCSGLESLDLSGWNTSKVTDIGRMFNGCSKLTTIRMKDCLEATRTKIQNQLTKDNITGVTIVTE